MLLVLVVRLAMGNICNVHHCNDKDMRSITIQATDSRVNSFNRCNAVFWLLPKQQSTVEFPTFNKSSFTGCNSRNYMFYFWKRGWARCWLSLTCCLAQRTARIIRQIESSWSPACKCLWIAHSTQLFFYTAAFFFLAKNNLTSELNVLSDSGFSPFAQTPEETISHQIH